MNTVLWGLSYLNPFAYLSSDVKNFSIYTGKSITVFQKIITDKFAVPDLDLENTLYAYVDYIFQTKLNELSLAYRACNTLDSNPNNIPIQYYSILLSKPIYNNLPYDKLDEEIHIKIDRFFRSFRWKYSTEEGFLDGFFTLSNIAPSQDITNVNVYAQARFPYNPNETKYSPTNIEQQIYRFNQITDLAKILFKQILAGDPMSSLKIPISSLVKDGRSKQRKITHKKIENSNGSTPKQTFGEAILDRISSCNTIFPQTNNPYPIEHKVTFTQWGNQITISNDLHNDNISVMNALFEEFSFQFTKKIQERHRAFFKDESSKIKPDGGSISIDPCSNDDWGYTPNVKCIVPLNNIDGPKLDNVISQIENSAIQIFNDYVNAKSQFSSKENKKLNFRVKQKNNFSPWIIDVPVAAPPGVPPSKESFCIRHASNYDELSSNIKALMLNKKSDNAVIFKYTSSYKPERFIYYLSLDNSDKLQYLWDENDPAKKLIAFEQFFQNQPNDLKMEIIVSDLADDAKMGNRRNTSYYIEDWFCKDQSGASTVTAGYDMVEGTLF